MLESNPLTTQPIFDHPQAIHDPNTGFIHPLNHIYPWKGKKVPLFSNNCSSATQLVTETWLDRGSLVELGFDQAFFFDAMY